MTVQAHTQYSEIALDHAQNARNYGNFQTNSQGEHMKFAIPLAEGKLTTHFGHCKSFALLTVNTGETTINQKTEVEAPPHKPGLLPVWLHEQGVTHVIAGGLGQRARDLMEEKGIQVLTGAPCLEPEVLVNQFLTNKLVLGANGCDH